MIANKLEDSPKATIRQAGTSEAATSPNSPQHKAARAPGEAASVFNHPAHKVVAAASSSSLRSGSTQAAPAPAPATPEKGSSLRSAASNQATNPIDSQLVESVSRNLPKQQEQRIKVTLSAPPTQDERTSDCQPSAGESTCSESFAEVAARRQSTATLISAPDHPARNPTTTQSGLSRSEQESELLRIASERRRKQRGTGDGEKQCAAEAALVPVPVAAPVLISEKSASTSNNKQALSPEPSAKQLAIYINGKIRSNSIFCRSSSSNSFNGLLNRFQSTSSSVNQPIEHSSLGANSSIEPNGSDTTKPRKGSGDNRFSIKRTGFLRTCLSQLKPAKGWLNSNNNPPSNRSISGAQVDESRDPRQVQGEKTQSYKLNPSSMFLRKAMRYYRLWIYCTNITILLGALTFILASLYVASDYRIRLLVVGSRGQTQSPSQTQVQSQNRIASGQKGTGEEDIRLSYSEPSVLVAYVAIAIQAGLLQAIGCFGAIRMRERWIQTFWYLILALTVFDVCSVVYWFGRYDHIVKSLRHHMVHRLSLHYGHASMFDRHNQSFTDITSSPAPAPAPEPAPPPSAESLFSFEASSVQLKMEADFDKILTEIVDKIQSDSQCCGIASSLDYKKSEWRRLKLEQLSKRELASRENSEQSEKLQPLPSALMRRVPLVPASCCRRFNSSGSRSSLADANRKPVILDDSQTPVQRVPAWSPSMVVKEVRHQQRPSSLVQKHRSPGSSSDPMIDGRWTGQVAPDPPDEAGDDEQDEAGATTALERRRLAKGHHYADPAISRNLADSADSMLAKRGRRKRRWTVESSVDERERVMSRFISEQQDDASRLSLQNDEDGDGDAHRENEDPDDKTAHYPAPLQDDGRAHSQAMSKLDSLKRTLFTPNTQQFRWPNKMRLSLDQFKIIESYLLKQATLGADAQGYGDNQAGGKQRAAGKSRSERAAASYVADGQTVVGDEKMEQNKVGNDEAAPIRRQREQRLADLIRADPELECAPRSYYDQATIYTRGCHQDLRAWLDSSAHILFVTGFCVLTVLKFCSLVLLRLEIREMIHKIRVLKGMATEYNALHDLEPYLPRSSDGLASPVGVGPTASSSANQVVAAAMSAGMLAAPGDTGSSLPATHHQPHHRRIGGSFSEAVIVAATVARQEQQQQQQHHHQQQHQHQLGFSHLSGRAASHLALMANLNPMHTGNLISQRRHTAVVTSTACPMMLPIGYCGSGDPFAAGMGGARPLIPSSQQQHRHSAHAVQAPSLAAPLKHRNSTTVSKSSAISRQYLGDDITSAANAATGAPSDSPQALMYPSFKRQTSAQSANNFKLDPMAPNLPAESRRSIH